MSHDGSRASLGRSGPTGDERAPPVSGRTAQPATGASQSIRWRWTGPNIFSGVRKVFIQVCGLELAGVRMRLPTPCGTEKLSAAGVQVKVCHNDICSGVPEREWCPRGWTAE